MNVTSTNIIRFPVGSADFVNRSAPVRPSPIEPEVDFSKVVAFPSASDEVDVTTKARTHGQLFAAHRIVTRVAEQLEQMPAL